MKPQKVILITLFSVFLFTGLYYFAFADEDNPAPTLQESGDTSQTPDALKPEHPILGSMDTPLAEPWASMIEEIVKNNPWFGRADSNYYMTNDKGFREVSNIVKCIPIDQLVSFAEHRVEYVRNAVKEEIRDKLSREKDRILADFEKGSTRIQFELYDLASNAAGKNWDRSRTRISLFNEILKDPKGKVFSSDFNILGYNYGVPQKDQIDIIEAYLRLLQSEFVLDRIFAMNNLNRQQDHIDKIVSALAEVADQPNVILPDKSSHQTAKSQRETACIALGSFKEKATDAVPALKKAMEDPDLKVRYAASASLYQIGYETQSQIDYLSSQISAEQTPIDLSTLIQSMIRAEIDMKLLLPKLAKLTTNEDKEVRRNVMGAISSANDKNLTLTVIKENIKSANPEIRLDAVNALGYIFDDKAIHDLLLTALNDTDINVKSSACSYLISHKNQNIDPIPYVIEILSSDQKPEGYYFRVNEEIRKLGPEAKQVLPALIKYLENRKPNQNEDLMNLIVEIGGSRENLVKHFAEILKSDDPIKTEKAIMILGEIGNSAVDTLPTIRNYIDTLPDKYTEDQIKDHPYSKYSLEDSFNKIIRSIKPGQKLPAKLLYSIMESGKEETVKRVIDLLAMSGESQQDIFSHMKGSLYSQKKNVPGTMARVIGGMGKDALDMIPDLLKAANLEENRKIGIYQSFYYAIDRIIDSLEKSDKDAVEYLLPLVGMQNDGYSLSKRATDKIFMITGSYDAITDIMLKKLKDAKDPEIYRLMEEIEGLGVSSFEFIPLLHEMVKNSKHDSTPSYRLNRILNSLIKSGDERITKELLLDVMDAFRSPSDMEDYVDLYIEKGGSHDVVAVRLADIVAGENYYESLSAQKVLWDMGGKAKAALPKLKEIYQKDSPDKNLKLSLQALIEQIQMAIQKDEKAK